MFLTAFPETSKFKLISKIKFTEFIDYSYDYRYYTFTFNSYITFSSQR